jgi:Flp pilus assembly protein TadD
VHRSTQFTVAVLHFVLAFAGPAAAADVDQPVTAIERLFRSGQTVQAFQRVDRAIAAQPGDPALRFLLGVMLTESKRETEAIQTFERLTQDFPELPEPFNNLAVLLAAQGQIDRSRALLEVALRNDPTYLTAHQNLGDVFARLAVRAYAAAASSARVDDNLSRKLRLARELAGVASTPR